MFGTPQSSFVFLPDSYLGSMIAHLGGRLITEGLTPTQMSSQLTPFSMEVLIQKDPAVIVMVHHGSTGEPAQQLQSNPAWGTLRAVKHHRVHTLTALDVSLSSRIRARRSPLLRDAPGEAASSHIGTSSD